MKYSSIGELIVGLMSSLAGERNTDSQTNSYLVVKQECNITQVTGATEVLVSQAPCHVLGVHANDGSTGHADLRDASAIGGGSVPKIDVNATAYANPLLFGARFESGLTVQGSVAGTDVSILWRPI